MVTVDMGSPMYASELIITLSSQTVLWLSLAVWLIERYDVELLIVSFHPYRRHSNFLELKTVLFVRDQSYIFLGQTAAERHLIDRKLKKNNRVSSAKLYTDGSTQVQSMSLSSIRKSNGPITKPCGTPASIPIPSQT